MKHSILGFQQDKLIKNNLTVEDALILRQIKDMYSTSSMDFILEDGVKYMWINYTYFSDQLPIIGSKRNLMRKIEYYGEELFILRILKHSKNGKKGNFSYIAPTVRMDELQDFDLMTESHKGYDRNDIRVMTESHNKDTSLKDTSLKEKELMYENIYQEYLKADLVKHSKLTTDMKKAIDLAKTQLGLNQKDFINIVNRHKERYEQSKKTQYPIKKRSLAELFGQKKMGGVSLICTDYMDDVWLDKNSQVENIKNEKIVDGVRYIGGLRVYE